MAVEQTPSTKKVHANTFILENAFYLLIIYYNTVHRQILRILMDFVLF